MPLTIRKLPFIALSVVVHHYAIIHLIFLKSSIEGAPFSKFVAAYHLLVIFPLSRKLIAIRIAVGAMTLSFAVFDPTFVVLVI
jgi:hypothetical protein